MVTAIDPDLLLKAYSIGVFPMSDSRDAPETYWVEPRDRAILPLDGFKLSRSLAKRLRSNTFQVTADMAFGEVVRRCAERPETWINGEIEQSYNRLHTLGYAHSIECWRDGRLAGGLYGVSLGAAFFGESMFSAARDASKVALAWLVARLKAGNYRLLDCQFMTPHLASLGAIEVSQKDYVSSLSSAVSGSGSGGGAARAGGAGLEGGAARSAFGALDDLLGASAAAGADAPSPGCVIAQLLGQTS